MSRAGDAFQRVPMLGSDEELVISLLHQTGVLLQPGHFFNFPAEGYLVASLITREEELPKQLAGHWDS